MTALPKPWLLDNILALGTLLGKEGELCVWCQLKSVEDEAREEPPGLCTRASQISASPCPLVGHSQSQQAGHSQSPRQ